MIPIVFLQAHEMVGPLCKKYGFPDGDHTYPMAGKFTSTHYEFEASKAGLHGYYDCLKQEAKLGKALFKGALKRPLANESRRGMTDNQQTTQLLLLDIDGMSLPGVAFDGRKLGNDDLRKTAEAVILTLPANLQNVSCIVEASSSFGRKPTEFSLHFHFFLTLPVAPSALKTWIKSLNYELPAYKDRLGLTPSMQGVKSIIDPCTAENSRIIYCAPPMFGDNAVDPFNGDFNARFIIFDKGEPTIDILQDIQSCNASVVAQKERAKRNELLKLLGLPIREHKTTSMNVDGVQQRVITNPNQINLTYASHDDMHVRYNLNGGNSNAYWVRRDSPAIVYCFKPDEQPFLFEQADRETYEWHVAKFGERIAKVKDASGDVRTIRPVVFIDKKSSALLKIEYDGNNDEIVSLNPTKREDATDWFAQHGIPEPPHYLTMDMAMRPTTAKQLDLKNLTVNLFRPSKYLKKVTTLGFDDVGYGYAHVLQHQCPHIWKVMFHMLGSDHEVYEHFTNWLAYIFQTRKKAKTAWLLQGVEGTGKGHFFDFVLRPLFAQHAVQKTLERIADDQFNGWMEEACILMVDEFNTANVSSGVKKAEAMLKNLITESELDVRRMRAEQVKKPNFLNFIFATNDIGAINLSDGQRRYNIAPRQERKIQDIHPEILTHMVEWDKAVANELSTFAAFLYDFKVDVTQVMKVLKTEAESEAVIAGKDAQVRFFDRVREGDLEFFTDIAFVDASQLLPSEIPRRAGVQECVKRWLRGAKVGEPMQIPANDLRIIYSFLAGKDMVANAFGRMLTTQGVHVIRSRNAYNQLGKQQRVTEVVWEFNETDINEIRAQNNLIDNVAPIDNGENYGLESSTG